MGAIFRVRELTAAIKELLEGSFPFVWVSGQLSNLSRPPSGHLYFTLKDEDAALAAVWFKGSQRQAENFDPLTGEVLSGNGRPDLPAALQNGQEVICAGRLSVYPARGVYQLVVELVQEAGKGRLQLEFELLKAELASKGYFDPGRKRPLPPSPTRVALVTSPSGAAVHDFLRIAAGRGVASFIRIYPALVQGEAAPAEVAAAINKANADGWAELVVLVRGGGSLEDLWAFNTRPVAEAIFNSSLPVLTGIGHEVDLSLADMVADLRAATPSHAAQLLWKERRELAQNLDELELALARSMAGLVAEAGARLEILTHHLRLLSPVQRLERLQDSLVMARRRLSLAAGNVLERAGLRLDKSELRLSALDPALPLQRGYALVRKADGSFMRSRAEGAPGDHLDLLLADGEVPVMVRTK